MGRSSRLEQPQRRVVGLARRRCCSCRCTTGADPGRGQHVEVAEQPLAGDVLRPPRRPRPGRRRSRRCRRGRRSSIADPAVPEVDEVLGGRAGAAAVVDVDRGDAPVRLLVDEHDRQPAAGEPVDGASCPGRRSRRGRRPSGRRGPGPRRRRRPSESRVRARPVGASSSAMAPRKPVATSSLNA